jgi:hypothetical protein
MALLPAPSLMWNASSYSLNQDGTTQSKLFLCRRNKTVVAIKLAFACQLLQSFVVVRLEEQSHLTQSHRKRSLCTRLSILVCMLAIAAVPAFGALNAGSPTGFFTNVASRLLKSELNLDLNRIPVYPDDGYTPSVHRLLQVTANLYDSTTTNWYPTIFRPHFETEGTNIFISGYEEVDARNETSLTQPLDLSDADARTSIAADGRVNVYGIPWVIGVKKGLPNFNEVALTSVFDVTRGILVTRPHRNASPNTFSYQQQLVMNLRNEIGVETWNSYRSSFTVPVEVIVVGTMETDLTNSSGGRWSNVSPLTRTTTANYWPGTDVWLSPDPQSFVIPLRTNFILIPGGAFSESQNIFLPTNASPFEPLPLAPNRWGMNVNATLQVVIRESSTKRVLDYVQLKGLGGYLDLSAAVQTSGYGAEDLWNTNLTVTVPVIPQGVSYQVRISRGDPSIPISDWNDYGIDQPSAMFKDKEIARFKAFYLAQNVNYNGVFAQNPTNLVVHAPFTPTRQVMQMHVWQANDPLVHHLASDLRHMNQEPPVNIITPPGIVTNHLPNVGRLNNRYEPWGGSPITPVYSSTLYDFSLKDPHVRSSEDWNFPSGEPLSLSTIGRIHRGTPWQTIYLKATNGIQSIEGLNAWKTWIANSSALTAFQTAPTNDWRLVDLLAPLLNTNDLRHLFSVNNPDPGQWRITLDGLSASTNSIPEQPLTLSSNSPQVAVIVDAIARMRSAQPFGYFGSLAEILATPELSSSSPWLGIAPGSSYAASDSAMEAIPSQLLGRLRADSVADVSFTNEWVRLRFTGYDGYNYAVEKSADLFNWISIGTNTPNGGSFEVLLERTETESQLYRSVLLP